MKCSMLLKKAIDLVSIAAVILLGFFVIESRISELEEYVDRTAFNVLHEQSVELHCQATGFTETGLKFICEEENESTDGHRSDDAAAE